MSEPKQEKVWKFAVHDDAQKEWDNLDGSIKETFKSILKKRLKNPHVPGSALHGDLLGFYKIKLRTAGYRLIYQVNDEKLTLLVISVGKREDSEAYDLAKQRVS
jgi:mRNA interferase RelE/StbE